MFATIGDAIATDESVAIAGFGTFSTWTRAARRGRKPRTGEATDIAASRARVQGQQGLARRAEQATGVTSRPCALNGASRGAALRPVPIARRPYRMDVTTMRANTRALNPSCLRFSAGTINTLDTSNHIRTGTRTVCGNDVYRREETWGFCRSDARANTCALHARTSDASEAVTPYTARCELPRTTTLRAGAQTRYCNRYRVAYGHCRSSAGAPHTYVPDAVPSPTHLPLPRPRIAAGWIKTFGGTERMLEHCNPGSKICVVLESVTLYW